MMVHQICVSQVASDAYSETCQAYTYMHIVYTCMLIVYLYMLHLYYIYIYNLCVPYFYLLS